MVSTNIVIKIDIYGKCKDNFEKYKCISIEEKIKQIEEETKKHDEKIIKQLKELVFDILNDRYYCKVFGINYVEPTNNDWVTLTLALLKSFEY